MNGQCVIINDDNWQEFIEPRVDGEVKRMGCVPRDYSKHPTGCHASAPEFPDDKLIPESEWEDRLKEQQAAKASLYDLRKYLKMSSLDQNGYGYCWAFSSVKAVMYVRALQHQPFEVLSAWAVASIIKNYRDEGGWGQESMDWIIKNGVPSLAVWPQHGTSRSLDTPQMRADAAKRKVTEWWDGSENAAKRKQQLVSALLLGLPVVSDFNWWSHSVCAMELVSLNPFRIRIDNSWTDSWSENGTGILEGSKAMPDAIVIPRVVTPSTV